jgi:two-component system cell cycle sensor histidine kinase/response regulator CckA
MTSQEQMSDRPRILLLEDDIADAKLSLRELARAGFEVDSEIISTSKEFTERLQSRRFDLILADYRLPDWTGLEALRWLRNSGIDTPFILVTGTLGDDLAIECIKEGATDYVLKEKLNRLPQACRRALEEERTRAERDRAERELRESEEQYRLLFDTNPLPMWVFDRETLAFLAVNEAAVRHYGFSRREFFAMTIKDMRPQEDIPDLLRETSRPNGGLSLPKVWRHRKKDGTVIDVEIASDALPFRGRQAELVLAHDITEAKRLEEQFRQAQKMEAIGRLAGGVAHDFNNMLSVILGYSELLQEGFEAGPARKGIDQIKSAAERAASLTRQLLAFSRQQVLAPRVLNLNAVVDNLGKMLRHMIGEDIDLVFTLGGSLGNVRADLVQVEQILMNLAVNARDAMPQGGKLIIETSNAELDAMFASTHPSVRPGSYVLLAVSDTGCGMDQNTIQRIYEPFFTTKAPGKGTGLGLSMVYGAVNQSGGSIWAYSQPGKGTTFKIYLPRVDEEPTVKPVNAVATMARGSETILVVEDEEPLRVLVAGFLKNNGYTVLQASGANEGMKLAREHGHIDLLITDVVMPGLSGSELASGIRGFLPRLKLLYMSGYTSDLIAQHGVLAADALLLEKPFTRLSLLTKVRMVLDGQ